MVDTKDLVTCLFSTLPRTHCIHYYISLISILLRCSEGYFNLFIIDIFLAIGLNMDDLDFSIDSRLKCQYAVNISRIMIVCKKKLQKYYLYGFVYKKPRTWTWYTLRSFVDLPTHCRSMCTISKILNILLDLVGATRVPSPHAKS